jgi:hypothetical protein
MAGSVDRSWIAVRFEMKRSEMKRTPAIELEARHSFSAGSGLGRGGGGYVRLGILVLSLVPSLSRSFFCQVPIFSPTPSGQLVPLLFHPIPPHFISSRLRGSLLHGMAVSHHRPSTAPSPPIASPSNQSYAIGLRSTPPRHFRW